uniref:RNA polymerase subunit B n=1 Tax=Lotharella vacuolata TaxID=74820 RepID=A0A0H5BKY6_9EUKA|nr:RNA polymerase subunit B [Lotharella vacuolata]
MEFVFNNRDISKNKLLYFKKLFLLKRFYESKNFFKRNKKINIFHNIYMLFFEKFENYLYNKTFCIKKKHIVEFHDYNYYLYCIKHYLYTNGKIFENYLFENTNIIHLYNIKINLIQSYVFYFYLYKMIIMQKKINLGILLMFLFFKKINTIYSIKLFNILLIFIKYSNYWYLNVIKNNFLYINIQKIRSSFISKDNLGFYDKKLIEGTFRDGSNSFHYSYVINNCIFNLNYVQKKYYFYFFVLFCYTNFKKLVKIVKIFIKYKTLNWVKMKLQQFFNYSVLKFNIFKILSILIKIFEINKIILMQTLIQNKINKHYILTELKISFSIYIKKSIFCLIKEKFIDIYNISIKKTFVFINKMITVKIYFQNFFLLIKNELEKKFKTRIIVFIFWTEILKFFIKCTNFYVINKLLTNGLKFFYNIKNIFLILFKKLIIQFLKNKNFKKLKMFLNKIIICFFSNSVSIKKKNVVLASELIINTFTNSYYLINICSILNSTFIMCSTFEILLKKYRYNYFLLYLYTNYLKSNDLFLKSLLVRYKSIKYIKNQDKKISWFDIITDISIKKEIDIDRDFYFIEKEILHSSFFNKELLFIIIILLTRRLNTFNKLFEFIKKIFVHENANLNFNYLLYTLKIISYYYGIDELIKFLRYIWLNFKNIRLKKKDFVKMCFFLVFINEFLGNFYISRKIIHSMSDIFNSLKSINMKKIYKNFEILHGNEENFRDYLINTKA